MAGRVPRTALERRLLLPRRPVPLSSLSPAVPGLRLRRIECLLRWLHPAVRIVRRRRTQRLPKRPPKRRLHLPRQPARRAAADRLPAARVAPARAVVARWIRSGSAFLEPLPQPASGARPPKPRFLPGPRRGRQRSPGSARPTRRRRLAPTQPAKTTLFAGGKEPRLRAASAAPINQSSRKPVVTGSRAARIAGSRPPIIPMTIEITSPRTTSSGVTLKLNTTCVKFCPMVDTVMLLNNT